MFYQSFPSVGAFGAFLALKLSRSQRLWQGAGAVHSQHLSLHVDGARRTPNIFLYDWRGTATITTASTPRATRRRGVRYARGPRRTLCSHDCQRAPRKLSVPLTILSNRCAPAASAQSSYLTLSGCQLLSQGGPGVRLARHRRRRQALYATRGGRGVRAKVEAAANATLARLSARFT